MLNNLLDISLLDLVLRLPAIILAFSFHEFCHGFAAYKLGDNTAKYDGRLSLNPLRHVDPIGLICLLLFRFGWAKPVMIDPRNFKDPKQDMALTALAGPLSNFLMAFVALLIYYPVWIYLRGYTAGNYLLLFLLELFIINISLGVFNMLPLPPLDGSKVFAAFLPPKLYFRFINFGRFGTIILLILIWTGVFSKILNPVFEVVWNFMFMLVDKIYFFL